MKTKLLLTDTECQTKTEELNGWNSCLYVDFLVQKMIQKIKPEVTSYVIVRDKSALSRLATLDEQFTEVNTLYIIPSHRLTQRLIAAVQELARQGQVTTWTKITFPIVFEEVGTFTADRKKGGM